MKSYHSRPLPMMEAVTARQSWPGATGSVAAWAGMGGSSCGGAIGQNAGRNGQVAFPAPLRGDSEPATRLAWRRRRRVSRCRSRLSLVFFVVMSRIRDRDSLLAGTGTVVNYQG